MGFNSAPDVRGGFASKATKVSGALIVGLLLSLVVSGRAWAPPPPQPPGPPTSVTVTPGDGQAVVTWQGNWSGWGYLPDGYVAKTNHGGTTCATTSPFSTSCTLTGLTDGLHYRVSVRATYRRGDVSTKEHGGPASAKVKFVPEAGT
jgi:hypothetical protein